MRLGLIFFIVIIMPFFSYFCFGMYDKLFRIEWLHLFHYDLRQKLHKFYLDRLSLRLLYLKDDESLFEIKPFFEAKMNVERDEIEKKRCGLEIGKDFFKWLYIGGSLSRNWTKEDWQDYARYKKRDYTDFTFRFLLSSYLLNKESFKLRGFIQEEYIYDLNLGKGLRNEVSIGLATPIGKFSEFIINWRHIDRIHYYDSDTFETAINFIF